MNGYWWLCPWLMFLVVYALSWILTVALLRTRLSVEIGWQSKHNESYRLS